MTRSIAIALCVALQALALTDAFQGAAVVRTFASNSLSLSSPRSSSKSLAQGVVLGATTESAFVPPPVGDGSSSSDDAEEDDDDEDVLEKVEQLGRGGAKVRLSHT
jgi:hypothetical protein